MGHVSDYARFSRVIIEKFKCWFNNVLASVGCSKTTCLNVTEKQVQQKLTGMENGPEDDSETHSTVKRQEISIGESEGVEHRAAKDKKQNHAAGSHSSVTTSETNVC